MFVFQAHILFKEITEQLSYIYTPKLLPWYLCHVNSFYQNTINIYKNDSYLDEHSAIINVCNQFAVFNQNETHVLRENVWGISDP